METKALLSFEWVEADGQKPRDTVVMLHGILGRRRNLFGFARLFVKQFPHLRVLLVDLRNHGESQGLHGPHTLAACAEDLHSLFTLLSIEPRSIIGHSFGAGVAFTFAVQHPLLRSVWLLDALPSLAADEPRKMGSEIEKILSALAQCSPAESKHAFGQCMLAEGVRSPLVAWLSMNLWLSGSKMIFRPDPVVAREMLDDFIRNFLIRDFKRLYPETSLFLVKADQNKEWQGEIQRLLSELVSAGFVKEFTLPHSGHFVHMDNAQGILEMMQKDFA
jgi:pimeloyl-ACP methyl ester carboxylesterase